MARAIPPKNDGDAKIASAGEERKREEGTRKELVYAESESEMEDT